MFAVIAVLQTSGAAATSGSDYADPRGVGLAAVNRVNCPMRDGKWMHVNNKTGRPIRLNYLNPSCLDRVLSMDAQSKRTSRDAEKSSNKDKQGREVDVKMTGPKGIGGGVKVANTSEHERSRESDHQRGSEEAQKFCLREDEDRLGRILDQAALIPSGLYKDWWAMTDDKIWFVRIFDDKKRKVLGEKIVGHQMKYIEITEDFRIVTEEEVPSYLRPCPHCLPIEGTSEEVMEKLADTCIRFNGHTYYPEDEEDEHIDYMAQDRHDSFISLRKSLIGSQNPFLLFKLGEASRRWFESKDAARQKELLKILKGPGGAVGDLDRHMGLIKVPERTTPFSIEDKPIFIVGKCPHCRKFPNRHAKA